MQAENTDGTLGMLLAKLSPSGKGNSIIKILNSHLFDSRNMHPYILNHFEWFHYACKVAQPNRIHFSKNHRNGTCGCISVSFLVDVYLLFNLKSSLSTLLSLLSHSLAFHPDLPPLSALLSHH